jgi:hypothetical protein
MIAHAGSDIFGCGFFESRELYLFRQKLPRPAIRSQWENNAPIAGVNSPLAGRTQPQPSPPAEVKLGEKAHSSEPPFETLPLGGMRCSGYALVPTQKKKAGYLVARP